MSVRGHFFQEPIEHSLQQSSGSNLDNIVFKLRAVAPSMTPQDTHFEYHSMATWHISIRRQLFEREGGVWCRRPSCKTTILSTSESYCCWCLKASALVATMIIYIMEMVLHEPLSLFNKPSHLPLPFRHLAIDNKN